MSNIDASGADTSADTRLERALARTLREEPTPLLRWVKRIVRPKADKEKLMTILQQAWKIIEYSDGAQPGSLIEWRDVPVEPEELSDGTSR